MLLSFVSNVIAVALYCFYFSSTVGVTAKPLMINNDLTTKVHFGGRWWYNEDDGSMEHSWGLGAFIVRFKGSTKLIMRMKSAYAGAYYTCRVVDDENGVEYKVHHDNNIEYVEVASGLVPNTEHVIRCGRNNEASWGNTVIYGVEIDEGGELLQAVDPNADNKMLRFEAIGDSISAGFKVTSTSASEPSTIANQDVFQTYIRYMADAWKTEDYNVIAKSGVSILDYDAKTGVVMSKEWECRQFWDTWQNSCPSLWDFSKWQADVVTINLGTNDFAFGDPTQQQFRGGYLQFIKEVRSKYPNALIACIEPIQHSCYGENNAKLTGIIDGLEQAVIDMNDPKVIYYETGNSANQWLDCNTNTIDFVDFTHPTVSGNTKFARRLLETMTDDVRRFFPNKCGGSGISCETGLPSSPTVALSPTKAPNPFVTPTIFPISVPTVSSPNPDPQTNGNSCVAITQNELPSGAWATNNLECAKCSTGYAYWPCDTNNPSLCRCAANDDNIEPSSPPIASPVYSSPTNSPIAIVPTDVPIVTKNSSRLIAYLGNWQSCPTDEQMAQYTHIVIAFAVSYNWNSEKNICSETCEIASPSVCENSAQPDLINKWKGMGKKIILSFGGAGMGGSWAGDNNNCWDYCFGRENQVVNQLTSIVKNMGLDGVDIDYEYFYEDNLSFTKGAEAQKFLKDVTVGLRNKMPEVELTHAPMETDLVPDKAYFNLLKDVASSLDFIMPQYYNGYVESSTNFPGALSHFTTITNEMFDGDASKIVYGFCISDCGDFNLDGYQSAEVMEKLSNTYPCNGGAFFWVANDDTNGDWSKIVKDQLDDNDDSCSNGQGPNPVSQPVVSPVLTPVSTPVSTPVAAPINPNVDGTCGGGNRGNNICLDQTLCCSEYGYCGYGASYCAKTPTPPVVTPTNPPVQSPTNVVGTCGRGNTGNKICLDQTMCCSEYGYCGNDASYCDIPTDPPVQSPTRVLKDLYTMSPISTPPQQQCKDSTGVVFKNNKKCNWVKNGNKKKIKKKCNKKYKGVKVYDACQFICGKKAAVGDCAFLF